MPPAPAQYKAPRAPLGLVLWSAGIGHEWFPAIATKVGDNSIRVMVFPIDSRVAMVRDSVRHASDPQFPMLLDKTGGIWDYTDEHKLLAGLAQIALTDEDGYAYTPYAILRKLRPQDPRLAYVSKPAGVSSSYGDDDPDIHGN